MKTSNLIDVVFKDKAKFDTQNPIIGALLTQIQSEKTNQKAIERDLNIAERLERFKQFNRKNNNNGNGDGDDDSPPLAPNFDPPSYYPSSPSKDDSNMEGDLIWR